MRGSTLAVVLMVGLALTACSRKSSLYLDSGRSESSPSPPTPKSQATVTKAMPSASSAQTAK